MFLDDDDDDDEDEEEDDDDGGGDDEISIFFGTHISGPQGPQNN